MRMVAGISIFLALCTGCGEASAAEIPQVGQSFTAFLEDGSEIGGRVEAVSGAQVKSIGGVWVDWNRVVECYTRW